MSPGLGAMRQGSLLIRYVELAGISPVSTAMCIVVCQFRGPECEGNLSDIACWAACKALLRRLLILSKPVLI